MSTTTPKQVAARLGLIGGALGVVAGLVQLSVGSHIPEWTGGQDNPAGLGLLTIVLSATAMAGGYGLRGSARASGARRAAALALLLIPASLCFSTVGRLWYLPGAILLVAAVAVLGAGPPATLWQAIRTDWLRVLISVLGGFELLMAVSAGPILLVAVGTVGGLCLVVAPWTRSATRLPLFLTLIGTVPFAALTWWTLATPLLAVLGIGLWVAVQRQDPADRTRLSAPSA